MIKVAVVAALASGIAFLKKNSSHGPHAATGKTSFAIASLLSAPKSSQAVKAAQSLHGNKSPAPSGSGHTGSAGPIDLNSSFRNYPAADTFSFQDKALIAKYAADSLLNARINVYLQRYRPETGVIMVCDLKSGHILAMGERQDSVISAAPKLAFGGGFPAASLIKILTATTALELKAKEVTDSIPQLGGYHTLYKRQLKADYSRRLPKITLQDAFAKSVNPAFGLLGQSVGAEALRCMAGRMGFNQPNLPACVAPSRIQIPDTGFSLAETSCGFTAKTTISPWHALEIARGAGDDGYLRQCTFAQSIVDLASQSERPALSDTGTPFISPENLAKLQTLMEGTVRFGTARKGFHSVLKASHLEKIETGGKTGSLDGDETKGRFDWFIGFAKLKDDPSRGLAFSIMQVHREYSSIHSSQLAALLIRDWLAALRKAEKAHKAELAYKAA